MKLDRCDYVGTRPLRTFTLGEILHRYSDEVCSTKKAGRNEWYALEKLLRNSSISEQRLDRLSERVVSVWRDQWLQNLAPASVCRYLGLLQHALEVAMREWDVPLSENVVGAVRRPRVDNRRERRLTASERVALLGAAAQYRNPLLRPFIVLA